MNHSVLKVCYVATLGAIVGAISERDVVEWTGCAIAVGASIFAWGLGRYHDYRKTRRQEDHEDRVNMIEDMRKDRLDMLKHIKAYTRTLCEMENRQKDLQSEMNSLSIEISKAYGLSRDNGGRGGHNQDEN